MTADTLAPELLRRMDAYWRAANYLSVAQIYLLDNPLLKRPLALADVKHMLLGHWGTTPGQNFIYAHLNRVIRQYDLDMIYVSGPGHGGPAVVSNTYLAVSAFEVRVAHDGRAAVSGPGDVNHVEIVFLDDPVQMHVDEVLPRRRAPVPQQHVLYIRERQRPLQQRIVVKINLADRKVIGRTPIGIQLLQ